MFSLGLNVAPGQTGTESRILHDEIERRGLRPRRLPAHHACAKLALCALILVHLTALAACGAPSPSSVPTVTSVETTSGQNEAESALTDTEVDGVQLEPKSVADGKLSLLVPSEFTEMDESMMQAKYPAERRPTLVYTDETGSVNVAVNHTRDRMPLDELESYHKEMDKMFRNLYPSAEWFDSGIKEINGRKWILLDVRTPAVDTDIRNTIVGTSLDGRLLLVTFNVIAELEDEWIDVAEAIVDSLSVSD